MPQELAQTDDVVRSALKVLSRHRMSKGVRVETDAGGESVGPHEVSNAVRSDWSSISRKKNPGLG